MLEKMNRKGNVAVAMSGGVDSSVAAALLVEEGYSVTGMILKLWRGMRDSEESDASFKDSVDHAQAVANLLKIPLRIIDAEHEFKKVVVEYFLDAQRAGLTPNPCFVCNQKIKWGLLLGAAIDLGAEKLATGHYARIVENNSEKYELLKGTDAKKDQSYVLAGLTQDQLKHATLPLGEKTKTEVREIAHRYNFPNSNRSDSQDLCFLGSLGQRQFIELFAPDLMKQGIIKNREGVTVGQHSGLPNYTIGQRRGLGAGNREPFFVLEKDAINNEIIIGVKDQLGTRRIAISKENWISSAPPNPELKYTVKIRYKAIPISGVVIKNDNGFFEIHFDQIVRDATPGQIAVIYDGDRVIGSGVITNVYGVEK